MTGHKGHWVKFDGFTFQIDTITSFFSTNVNVTLEIFFLGLGDFGDTTLLQLVLLNISHNRHSPKLCQSTFFPNKKLYNDQQETTDMWSDFGDTTLNNSEDTPSSALLLDLYPNYGFAKPIFQSLKDFPQTSRGRAITEETLVHRNLKHLLRNYKIPPK